MLKKCDTSKPYIFVSYSHTDEEVVHRDVAYLQDLGYNLWIDEPNLGVGTAWNKKVLNLISNKNCQAVLFFISEESLLSDPCSQELKHTFARQTMLTHNKEGITILSFEAVPISNISDFIDNIIYQKANELDTEEFDEFDKKFEEIKTIVFGEQMNVIAGTRLSDLELRYDKMKDSFDLHAPLVVPNVDSTSKASRESEVKVSTESKSMTDRPKELQSVAHQSNEIVQESISAQHLESVQTAKEEKKTAFSKVVNKPQKSVVSSDSFIADVWANASSHNLVEQWGLEARKPQKDFVNVVSKILKDKKFSHYFDWQVSGTSLTNSLRDSSSQKKLGATISEHESEIIAKINERVSEELADSVVNSLLDKAKPAIQIRTTALNKNADAEQVALWFLKATDIMMSVISEYC